MTLAQQFKSEGRAEGEIAAIRQMAIKMLNKGLDPKDVSQLTEISEKDLQELVAKARKRK